MSLRAFLRKRLHLDLSLVEAPVADGSLANLAAAGEASTTSPKRFTANLSLGNVIAVVTLTLTLIGGYVSVQSSIADMKARNDAERADTLRLTDAVSRVNNRLTETAATKDTFLAESLKTSQQLNALQSSQLQLYGALLAGKGR